MNQSFDYRNFILLNPLLSFHPGGLMNTAMQLRRVPDMEPRSAILDYGCGTGLTMMMLRKLGYANLYGFDTHRDFIRSASYRFSLEAQQPVFVDQFDHLKTKEPLHLILIESVFSFLDNTELDRLLGRIEMLKTKYGAKYLAITEVFSAQPPDEDFLAQAREIYGISTVRSAERVKDILLKIAGGREALFFEEISVEGNDEPIVYDENEKEDRFLEKIALHLFDELKAAKEYRLEHARRIKDFSHSFCRAMRYCNAVIQL